METIRKPFQGITNIIRFNWHYYLFIVILLITGVLLNLLIPAPYTTIVNIACILGLTVTTLSLFVSYFVYDLSSLYRLNWMDHVNIPPGDNIVNINAGFDETSSLLKGKYPKAVLNVFDFYDAGKHTELSIKRARRAYPPYPGTVTITTSHLPMENETADKILLVLAAHEIRNDEERSGFFQELYRVLKPGGSVLITEHLRDLPNFMAYNIGFFHFLSRPTWLSAFTSANFYIISETKITPFITTFTLKKNVTAS